MTMIWSIYLINIKTNAGIFQASCNNCLHEQEQCRIHVIHLFSWILPFITHWTYFLMNYCSSQLVDLRTWLVLVLWENINVFPVLPTSPLVSMATWQGMKDKLLALKFLTALMKMLQEVHSKLYSYKIPVPKTAVIQGLSDAVGML